MAGEIIFKPDDEFIERVIAAGGDTVKKCYQCGTCCVVCNPTPDSKPFPRKEMLQAQWGLKEVLKDPDIWLCHQCSDCTVHCPREAKPGEVMNALRKLCIEHYATPSILAKMVGDSKFLSVLLAFPVLLLLAALKVTGHLAIPEGPIVYSKFFPIWLIDLVFTGAAVFAVVVLAKGAMLYWKDLKSSSPWHLGTGNLVGNLLSTLKDILLHNRFRLCETTYNRSINHLLVLFGFIFLGIVTSMAFFYEWVLHYDSPYPIYDPLKLLAIAGTIFLLYGIYHILRNRQNNAEKAGLGTYYDYLFIYVVLAVGATGLGAWLFRLLEIRILAYCTYFLHLTSVFFLFFYAPYSKMAHFLYRTVAMLCARMSDRGF